MGRWGDGEMGRWEPTPNPSQEGNMGRWGDGEMGSLVLLLLIPIPCSLFPVPCSLFPTPYSLTSCLIAIDPLCIP
ncbi:hypothetical protein [Moorena sp. SIO3H5]|uniref:hypothetical protein n=1 Tax=Moorena sp. SIO3H5 TaxID=2607834 RepID=UPI0013B8C16F|nr:hypothetical protein [Moorena sp. SIO3H5]NEO69754.1 hypothetical protein [Moorena sp. SIO3H5]